MEQAPLDYGGHDKAEVEELCKVLYEQEGNSARWSYMRHASATLERITVGQAVRVLDWTKVKEFI